MSKAEKESIKTLREVLECIENETRSLSNEELSAVLNNVKEELVIKG